MSDQISDLSQDQFATLFTNGTVNHTVNGQEMPLNMASDAVSLTEAQAELIYHCLSLLETDTYAAAETARRTQENLKARFELGENDGYFDFDQ